MTSSMSIENNARSVWRVAPGDKAFFWETWKERSCISLGWSDVLDFTTFKKPEALDLFLKKRGGRGVRGIHTIRPFVHEMIHRGGQCRPLKGLLGEME